MSLFRCCRHCAPSHPEHPVKPDTHTVPCFECVGPFLNQPSLW